jgi:hypothetical protein
MPSAWLSGLAQANVVPGRAAGPGSLNSTIAVVEVVRLPVAGEMGLRARILARLLAPAGVGLNHHLNRPKGALADAGLPVGQSLEEPPPRC